MSFVYVGIGIVLFAWLVLALLARRRRSESTGIGPSSAIVDEESDDETRRMHLIEEEVRIREDLSRDKQQSRDPWGRR